MPLSTLSQNASSVFPENYMQVDKQTRKSWLSWASTWKSEVQLKLRKGQRLGKLEGEINYQTAMTL